MFLEKAKKDGDLSYNSNIKLSQRLMKNGHWSLNYSDANQFHQLLVGKYSDKVKELKQEQAKNPNHVVEKAQEDKLKFVPSLREIELPEKKEFNHFFFGKYDDPLSF